VPRALPLFLLLAALLAPAAHGQAVVVRGADPESYGLELSYSDRGAGVLAGRERIEFVNRGPAPLEAVWLRLWANGPDSCRPRRIAVAIEPPARAGSERVRCSAIEVRLGAPVAPGASGSLTLGFTVRGRRARDRFGRIGGVAFLGNAVPVLAVEDGGGLHLDPYSGRGESFYSLAARWDAVVRVPARLRAATTGAVSSETVSAGRRTLSVHSAQARDFALAVGPLRVRRAAVGGVRVRVHFGPRVRGVRRSLRAAGRALRALSRRLGPYPSIELDVVLMAAANDVFAGMEYPDLVFALPLPEVVAHEVAHQWWYGVVGNDQFHEPWLDESFAQYSHERLYPLSNPCRPGRPYELVAPRRRHVALDSPMSRFERGSPEALGEVVYFAGSCALQTLERRIGRARMTALLRLLQARHRHGVMTKADVLRAILEVAPGFPLARWLRESHLSP
jgi:hypothetical protein